MKKRHSKKKRFVGIGFIIFLFVLVVFSFLVYKFWNSEDERVVFLAGDSNEVVLYTIEDGIMNRDITVYRGSEVLFSGDAIVYDDCLYDEIIYNDDVYYVLDSYVSDSADDVVLESVMYVRTAASIIKDRDTGEILTLAEKGDELDVVGFDYVSDDGYVNVYEISKDGEIGYIYGKYLSYNKMDALASYSEEYDKIYSEVSNPYGGGDAVLLDYYPVQKPSFDDNEMPDEVYALYLNCGSDVINNIDAYIEFASDTYINAFVVDIKDNESPAYPALTFEKYSMTSYERAINSYESYKNAIDKLKDAGFYVIGRITVFKDNYYIQDNPDKAISSVYTGSPYLHNKSYWPSAYDRDVWFYNVSLAKEAVLEFGFNEINFDYVRFPDRMQSVEEEVDLHNTYNEDKTQAIQRFVQYATDELHELGVYVSIDVFGETTNGTYTTAYGQYWPAISNVSDVISGMPYPDHFSDGYYGISKPWNHPYELINMWARNAYDRQLETPSPARVRTWIQAYDVMKSVDSVGISYNANEVYDEIRALYDASISGGFITWLSSSSLEKYSSQKSAFQIDYGKEYGSNGNG